MMHTSHLLQNGEQKIRINFPPAHFKFQIIKITCQSYTSQMPEGHWIHLK